jgi:hypothetical protein
LTEQPPAEIQDIAQVIERYLSAHPNAADTVEGIANYWLKSGRVKATAEQVQQAISLLIDWGLMSQKTLPDGTALYTAQSRE